jgi:hypothetical protein
MNLICHISDRKTLCSSGGMTTEKEETKIFGKMLVETPLFPTEGSGALHFSLPLQ